MIALEWVHKIIPYKDGKPFLPFGRQKVKSFFQKAESIAKPISKSKEEGVPVNVRKINHDMRNVLCSTQLFADSLLMIENQPECKKIHRHITRAIERAVGLCDTLSLQGGAAHCNIVRQMAPLKPLLFEVREMLCSSSKTGVVSIHLHCPKALSIDADQAQLFRALFNLAFNALVAMRDKKQGAEMFLRAERTGEGVSIEIEDNGPGLPKVLQKQIREAKNLMPAQASTHGMGLAITREIVEMHGGRMQLVISKAGKTVFRLAIPDTK